MKRFSNILFVNDSDANNTTAFQSACTLSRNNQARLTVVGAVDDLHSARGGVLHRALIEEQSEQLNALVGSAALPDIDIEKQVLMGSTFIEIIRDVIRSERDLLVKSVEFSKSKLFSGTDMKLLKKCPCPVWLIQPDQPKQLSRILVALDYDPENQENLPLNRQLLQMAFSLALSEFAELFVVHAWQMPHENIYRSPRLGLPASEVDSMVEDEKRVRQKWLSEFVNETINVVSPDGTDIVSLELQLLEGSARDAIPGYANSIGTDLVVMGTVGRTGISGLLIGNSAEAILQQIECSVLAVKPAAFVCPISVADTG